MEGKNIHLDITKFLPHRAPMLMVDYITAIDEESVTAEFFITPDCVFLSKDKLSEVGLIENAAQTCSSIIGQTYFEKDDTEGKTNTIVGFISGIKNLTIHQLPSKENLLRTEAQLVSMYETGEVSLGTISCSTFLQNEIIVDCTFNFLIKEVSHEKK